MKEHTDEPSIQAATTWLPEVKTWIAVRLDEPGFVHLRVPGYAEHLYARMARARAIVLTEAEFLQVCRGTALSLVLGAQLFIEGCRRLEEDVDIAAAMFAVLPDYQSFYSFEEALSESISLNDVAKMQMLEGEMFAITVLFLSKETEWFPKALADAEILATQYWQNKSEKRFAIGTTSRSTVPAQAATEDKGSKPYVNFSSLIWYTVLAMLAVVWLWNSKFYWRGGEAIGRDLVSLGLPLLLLYFSGPKLHSGLLLRHVVAPKKVLFGLLAAPATVLSIADFIDPSTQHVTGALELALLFGLSTVVVFGLALKQQRESVIEA